MPTEHEGPSEAADQKRPSAVADPEGPSEAADHEGPSAPSGGRVERVKAIAAAARQRVETTRATIDSRRPHNAVIDVALSTVERDAERGGGLIAGALAYRIFFWMLPFVLVVVGALGFLSSADDTAPRELAERVGVVGFAATSIVDAAEDAERTRIWALVVGVPALYLASASFVKALSVGHALVWGLPNRKISRTALAVVTMNGIFAAILVALVIESDIRNRTAGLGLAAVGMFVILVGLIWLFVLWHMPRPSTSTWGDLLPGAILVAAGAQAVHVLTVYYVARRVESASTSYGQLGTATAILLSLFFLARVVVFGVALNAELWDRRHGSDGGAPVQDRAS